jgi:hypothetical protein
MRELSYKERLAIAYLKKPLEGVLSNLLYKLAIAKLVRTYEINLINFSFTFKVLKPITRSLTLKTRIILKATLNITRSEDKYMQY